MGKGSWLRRLGLVRAAPVSLDELRDLVVAEIARRRPDVTMALVGEAEIEVEGYGTPTVARGYACYREHPGELDIVIRQLADLALYEPEPAKPEELIVLVRPDSFNPRVEGLLRPLPGGLIAIVALDRPEQYVFSTGAELRKDLDMSSPAIWARAMDNLGRRLSMEPPAYREGHVMGLKTDIGLASSLLVLDDYWEQEVFTSRGDWVVAPLERDELVLAPLTDTMAVRALRNVVARRESSAFLCDTLLLRRNGAWEEFE